MLRAAALVAVRQQHRQAAAIAPLDLAGRDELVDHDLRVVHEVAELRLPHDQRVVGDHRVAVFEAEHGLLRQRRVEHREHALLPAQAAQGHVHRLAVDHRVLVVPDALAMEEAAAADVEAAQAHVAARAQQRCVGERLRQAPVHAVGGRGGGVPPALDQRGDVRVQAEVRGRRAQAVDQLLQPRERHAAARGGVPARGRRAASRRRERRGRLDVTRGQRLRAGDAPFAIGDLLGRRQALLDHLRAVARDDAGQRAHDALHRGLRDARIVMAVVAVASIADDVDQDVGMEALAELHGHLRGLRDEFRAVAVDVEDGDVVGPRDVGAVQRRARIEQVRDRGADLVVQHDVHRAADAVAPRACQVEGLGDDALAAERGVAVHDQRQHVAAMARGRLLLHRARHAGDDGRHALKVRGVVRQQHLQPARRRAHAAREAQVFLDVPGREVRRRRVAEQRAQFLGAEAHDVGEHVQPSPVRHAHDKLAGAFGGGGLDGAAQEDDVGLAALQAEALVARIGGGDGLLEALGGEQHLVEREAPRAVRPRAADARLDALVEPVDVCVIAHVRGVQGQAAAIALAQAGLQRQQVRAGQVGLVRDVPEPARRRLAAVAGTFVERVDIRLQVARLAVARQQPRGIAGLAREAPLRLLRQQAGEGLQTCGRGHHAALLRCGGPPGIGYPAMYGNQGRSPRCCAFS